jgi:ABC-type transport system involved in cytochrome bd biosynthesis fused ATPase/permease subunit
VQAAALAAIVAGAAFGDGAPTGAFVVLGAAFAVRAATSAATEWFGRAAASQALAALRRRVGEHVLAARAPRVEDARRGELATAAVHGVDALGEYYAKAVPQLALAAVVPPAFVAVVLWHDPVVGILLALTIPLVIVFMVLVGRESAERIAERRLALGVLGTHFLDVVRGLPTLRAHGRAEALAMVGTAIAAAVVGVQLAAGALTFETGLFVLLLAPEVYVPLRLAGQRYHAAEDGAAAATSLLELLDRAKPRRMGEPGGDPGREPLVVRGVTVAGGASRPPSLDGCDVTFAPGRITGLIGPSGSGKSTLLALLAALREPDAGTVTCGGAELGGEGWWPRVAWLGQRPALLRGPLRETLTLQTGAPGDAARADLELALRRAGALGVVGELEEGLDTRVGPGGRPLAGGQVQRLALAGALLSDAPLLLLDEPTAHLDPAAAEHAADGIREAARGRTAIIATHDPAVMAICDDIVELRDGRAAEAVMA